jgi:hypothetical protein
MDLNEFLNDVDTDSIEANSGRSDPIPAGDYTLQVVEQELRQTKAGTGMMLSCQFKVVDGEYENRVVFHSFNIRNPNAQAQIIGIGQLKALCLATGVPFEQVRSDTSVLAYVPFTAKVGLSKTSEAYPDPRNEIKAFKAQGSPAPRAATPAPKAATPAARPASTSGGLPWKNKPAAAADNIPF